MISKNEFFRFLRTQQNLIKEEIQREVVEVQVH